MKQVKSRQNRIQLYISGLAQEKETLQKITRGVMGSAFKANNVPDQSCMQDRDGRVGVRNKSSTARLCK